MLSDPGYAHQSFTDPIPRGAACQLTTSDLRLAASIREGGDAPGRLGGTPPITRGSRGSAEGGPGRSTHLLHVDLHDVVKIDM